MPGILPDQQQPSGLLAALAQTWPARMAKGILGGLTLPGDVYAGRVDPMSDQGIGRSFDLAGTVMGGGFPMAERGAVGMAGGNLASQARRSEQFNWPVATEYGKTVEMPITVNPTRGHIQRALSEAEHGDVRALRAPNGDVYMWPANEALHRDIASNFDLPFKNLKDLQGASYLFNRADVEKLGGYKNFDDLVSRLAQ